MKSIKPNDGIYKDAYSGNISLLSKDMNCDKRVLWIDWLKIIGMLFIVWGHFLPSISSSFIYSFSVPLFFFLSGYLNSSKKRSFSKHISKIFYSLFIPMLSIVIINWFLNYREAIFTMTYNATTFKENFLIPLFYTAIGSHNPLLHELWFIYNLVIIRIISYFFKTAILNRLLLCSSLIIMAIIYYHGIHNSISFYNLGGCIFYYTLGVEIKLNIKLNKYIIALPSTKKSTVLAIFVCLLIIQCYFSNINGCNYLWNTSYGNYLFLSILLSITGIILGILITSLIKIDTFWLSYINTGAILILGIHYKIIEIISYKLNIQHDDLMTLFISIVLLLGFIPIIILVKRLAPWMLGR